IALNNYKAGFMRWYRCGDVFERALKGMLGFTERALQKSFLRRQISLKLWHYIPQRFPPAREWRRVTDLRNDDWPERHRQPVNSSSFSALARCQPVIEIVERQFCGFAGINHCAV